MIDNKQLINQGALKIAADSISRLRDCAEIELNSHTLPLDYKVQKDKLKDVRDLAQCALDALDHYNP